MDDTLLDRHYTFRAELVSALERDIIGPSVEDEVIFDAPVTRYAAGVLFPRDGSTVAPENELDVPEEGADTLFVDPPVALANARYPSSMGVTFGVDTDVAKAITVRVEAATYEPLHDAPEGVEIPPEANEIRTRRRGEDPLAWRRCPMDVYQEQLSIEPSGDEDCIPIGGGLELFVRQRPADEQDVVAVTLALVNQNVQARGRRDELCFFQPRISVAAEPEGARAFVDRARVPDDFWDRELISFAMLYRDAPFVAIGHGCAAQWRTPSSDGRASEISTTFVPTHELRLSQSNPGIGGRCLELQWLTKADRADVCSELTEFCDSYQSWIGDRRDELEPASGIFREIGDEHLANCDRALKRMREGVRLLEEGPQEVWRAFRLSNSAMLEQRARSSWLKSGKSGSAPSYSDEHRWYPFQLAFQLQCLRGIADAEHPDREIADLLWFPTGGGKTEAYLGLIAFTTFLRRLRLGAVGGGVTALMRYTLRLLTIQQFERAALLICCCERIRRETTELGDEPISIGLWVGSGGSPNSRSDAKASLKKLSNGGDLQERNPVQLHACPWCGTRLDHRNYYLNHAETRLMVSCRQDECEFVSALPVFLVDDDVYDHRPTLIIATADKYAGLPWRQQAGALFNLYTEEPPPELIIQDELHLISGPLGTLAGLYETAINELCTSSGGAIPKVVASTATIRRAHAQSQGLFARQVSQFPPPGLTAGDSYFAVEATPAQKGTRLYVGLLSPSASQTTLMVRTYASLLQTSLANGGEPEERDPYWTLVGYFNSLRVLGGARMQVQDDVNERVALLAGSSGDVQRSLDNRVELTSRESSADIPRHLASMQRVLPDEDTLDIILATNMISVGVDVDRLGLMVMMGQPPSTSEYIQATSRVGRKHPGLVVTLYNATRSRDRSHYEMFLAYHSALYRGVESTSVTPFSPRARDRALHAVLVALARLRHPELRSNDGAGRIKEVDLSGVREDILARVRAVEGNDACVEDVARELEEVETEWRRRAEEVRGLVYEDWSDPAKALLVSAGSATGHQDLEGFPTMWSLRDVDQSSNLHLIVGRR